MPVLDALARATAHLKNALLLIFVWRLASSTYRSLIFRGLAGTLRHALWTASKVLIARARSLPTPAKAAVQAEIDKTLQSMETSLIPAPKPGDPAPYTRLPDAPLDLATLRKELDRYKHMAKIKYADGRVSGAVYHGGEDLYKIITEAYAKFCSSNPLHPDLFPGVRKMEAECVAMVVDMFHGGPDGCGSLTSGGTESILMACKAYREMARQYGITEPEMVVPETIHAAFDKASHYFGIKMVKIPLGPDFKVDLKLVERAINGNTILLAGSAPNFPHGIIDDIPALSEIAQRYRIPLHVDCCLGSFLVASMDEAGFPLEPFDFRLPGVASISADTHKYGFAPKGSSVIMYRNKELRKYQYFVAPDWCGGIYASPTIAGSRPGALIAGCWATMLSVGRSGYVSATRDIVGTARAIASGIRKHIPELEVIGDPQVSVVSFRDSPRASSLNVLAVNDAMSKRGWNLNALQYPAAVHIACTRLTVGKADPFVADLKQSVQEVLANPDAAKHGSAAIYGIAASIPDRSIIEDIVVGYLDLCMKP